MGISEKLELRYAVGALAIIIMGILTYSQAINGQTGVIVIVGILAALGLYEGGIRISGNQ